MASAAGGLIHDLGILSVVVLVAGLAGFRSIEDPWEPGQEMDLPVYEKAA